MVSDKTPVTLSSPVASIIRSRLATSTDKLEVAILAYIAETNADLKPFVWTKTANDILASVAKFCQRTSNSHH